MVVDAPVRVSPPLLRMIADRVRISTGNRVRGLAVEESNGQVVLKGSVTSRHTKQLALHAALEYLSGEDLIEQIVVA